MHSDFACVGHCSGDCAGSMRVSGGGGAALRGHHYRVLSGAQRGLELSQESELEAFNEHKFR